MRLVKRRKRRGRYLDWLRNVTWEEIEEAGDTMQFELYDIDERASIYGRDLERVIEENIRYILEREGLYDPRKIGAIVIPAGGLHWECSGHTCWYSADFEVFDKSGNKILAYGTATGTMIPLDEETVSVMDMYVSMPTEHVEKLKRLVESVGSTAKALAEATRRLVASVFNPSR